MRLVWWSSYSIWSYSLIAATNKTQVTPSKLQIGRQKAYYYCDGAPVQPLSALIPLSAHIDQPQAVAANDELSLDDACCTHSRASDVGVRREIFWLANLGIRRTMSSQNKNLLTSSKRSKKYLHESTS
jgi:hypothetical protein